MSIDAEPGVELDLPESIVQIDGRQAVRLLGDVVTRLAAGRRWELAAFGRNDDLLFAASSDGQQANVDALRSELRLQRFAGSVPPLAGGSLATDEARTLCIVLGDFRRRTAILRIFRSLSDRSDPTPWPNAARFIEEHADAFATAIFGPPAGAPSAVVGRTAPIAFGVDPTGTLLWCTEEATDDTAMLRQQFLPRNGELPATLRAVVTGLLERYHAQPALKSVASILPFCRVRLAPLRAYAALPAALLVTVEWLRGAGTLERAATRYTVSKRELQVLRAMLLGAPVEDIAAELSISPSTVVFHLKNMLRKTASKNRVELAARMLGWTPDAGATSGASSGSAEN